MKKISALAAILVLSWATANAQSWANVPSAANQVRDPVNGPKSDTLKRLDARSLDLSQDLDRLHERMKGIKEALQTTGTLLTIPGVAHKQLTALEASLSTADRLLQTAEVVPQTREKAKRMRAQIGPALTKVTAAKVKIGAIAATTTPLSVKFLKAAKRLGQADTVLVAFNVVAVRPEPFATTVAQECVNGAAANLRQCMQQKVDGNADDIDSVVVELDRVVELLLTDVGTIDGILPALPAINTPMGFLDGYQKLLAPIIESLDNLITPLRKLDDLLNSNLKKCYEVPTSPFTTQRVCTPDISMRVIVQGVGAIMNEIENLVGGVALELLKQVGLDKIAEALLNMAQEPLNIILRELNLDLEINLGDIDAVINLPAQLEVPLTAINLDFDSMLPELDVNSPSLGFPGFASGLSVKSIDPSWFNPGNLKPGDIPVFPCQQGLFLCKDQGEQCDSKRDNADCLDELVCSAVQRREGSEYRCVGRGNEGDLCAWEGKEGGTCADGLICRPKNDDRYYCVQKGSAQQGDSCDRVDAGAGSIQCAGNLVCRNTGYRYACVGRGEPNDLCAEDDAGRGSKSCGGNLICRNTGRRTWHCIGRGLEGDLCSEEEAGTGSQNCGGALKCRWNGQTTQSDGRDVGPAYKCGN